MTHRMIYLIGAPGAGKTTLMAKMTEHLDRHKIAACENYPVAHDVLTYERTPDIAGVELGVRRERFGGTDALPASIIEKAIPWIAGKPYELILAEGARLANRRFLTEAALAGYEVHLGFLDHSEVDAWRAAREAALDHAQSPAWVKGRYTASLSLAKHFAENPKLGAGVKVYIGSPETLLSDMEHLLG